MNLPKFALSHKPIVLGFALVMLVWGLTVFLDAPRREDPEFTIREAVITTDWPGATAQQVEELVTDKVEIAAANIDMVRRVQSTSMVGRSVVQVTALDSIMDIRPVWAKLRAEMDLLAADLPAGASIPAVNDNFGNTAALVLALYQDPESAKSRPYTPRELEVFAKRLRDRLTDLRPTEVTAEGRIVPITTDPAYVARLDLYGVQREVIYLETDAGVWSKLKLTSDELMELLAQRNVVAPAGVLNTSKDRVHTRLAGNFDAVNEIDQVVVGRVASGAESPDRQTIEEFERSLAAGEGSGASEQPPAYEVPVYLDDLRIKVRRDYMDPPDSLVRFGDAEFSAPAIGISFTMKSGNNISWIGEAVDRLLEDAHEDFLPPDILVAKVSDPPAFVEKKINDVVNNLIEAVVLVLLILGLLAGFRVALVTAASVPLIMLSALALMRLWDVEIEQISLAALIVSLGLLVDNAIVTSENTTRFLNAGMPPEEAAIEGCNQVSMSLLWSTLTTVSVFIPMAFVLPGDIAEYVFSLPVVVALTLGVSWLCAMTVTPILSYYILARSDGRLPIVVLFSWIGQKLGIGGKEASTTPGDAGSERPRGEWFEGVVRFAIAARIPLILGAFALLFASLMLPVKPSFFPFSDRNQFSIDLWLPTTAPIYRTDETAKQVETILQRLSTVTWKDGQWASLIDEEGEPVQRLTDFIVYVGTGGPRFYAGLDPGPSSPRYAGFVVNVANYDAVEPYIADIRRAAWSGIGTPGDDDFIPPIAGARVVPRQLVMGTPVASPIEYRLTGPRLASETVLRRYGERIKDVLRDSGMVWDVHDSWGERGLQFDVDLKSDRAKMAGVTNETVAHTLNAYYSGLHLTTFREGDQQIPIILRLPSEQRSRLENVKSAYVEGYTGKVPLNSVAEFNLDRVPVEITRYQRERSMRIRARPEPELLPRDIQNQLRDQMAEIEAELPPGYRIEYGGIEEEALKGERGNAMALAVGGILVVFCLLLQYNSAIKPLLIILTVPLSIIGAMLGLWIRGIPLGFMETLGFLALFGTVLNAAILLIDFTTQKLKEKLATGQGRAPPGERSYCGLTREAFRSTLAESAQTRLMPIFLTTATTVAGLTSLMFGGGPLFMGLATAFACGLIVGSAITLLVLPALMALFVENFHYQLVSPDEAELETTSTSTAETA